MRNPKHAVGKGHKILNPNPAEKPFLKRSCTSNHHHHHHHHCIW